MCAHDDSAEEDEESFWGCPLPGPDSGLALVVSCFDGARSWEPGWEPIEGATSALGLLEELPGHTPDWETLLAGLEHLQVLSKPDMKWPPLHDFSDFLEIGDLFHPFEGSNEHGTGSLLYIDKDQPVLSAALMAEFNELTRRLRDYPPLKPFIEYM
jgi:hypothetical protein